MTAPEAFEDRLGHAAALARTTIEAALENAGDGKVPNAMRYATRGGKGLRAFLVIESAGLFGIEPDIAAPAAAAIEAIHAYSLIHDDLPAMDDDDLRRGQPTVHIAFDEATAVLAGDALQAMAFEFLADLDAPATARIALIKGLARAAGHAGMVGGQAMDIAAETSDSPLNLDQIAVLQAGKTGALFSWAAISGALMAGQDPAPLGRFASAFGLAFQIADDLLDVTGDEEKTGKRLNKDEGAGKATFVSLLGVDEARDRASQLIDEAVIALRPYGEQAVFLAAAADFVLSRDR